jgi:hypothetical protein
MKFKVGDKVRVLETETFFKNCEGTIIDFDGMYYIIDFYKGNDIIGDADFSLFDGYLREDEIECIIKLDVKKLRENKNTTTISTKESLKDIIPFFEEE